MALHAPDVRDVVERVFARQDVLDACSRRDLGVVVEVLGTHGVTQGQIAGLTGLPQGRLSEYKKHKHAPKASSTFEKFADGLDIPSAARQALGLAADRPSITIGTPPSAALPSDVGLVYPDAATEGAVLRSTVSPSSIQYCMDEGETSLPRCQCHAIQRRQTMAAPTRTPRSKWIQAGLRALATGGPNAVRVELLAKDLGVTRGGFCRCAPKPMPGEGSPADQDVIIKPTPEHSMRCSLRVRSAPGGVACAVFDDEGPVSEDEAQLWRGAAESAVAEMGKSDQDFAWRAILGPLQGPRNGATWLPLPSRRW
jgi:hypothetical protein